MLGQPLDTLDSPQLLIDLDIVDANLRRMFDACRPRGVQVRVHFKSLKCAGLAKHISAAGADGFLCAKLCEAEVLADAGLTDIFIANQLVGPIKLRRLAELARRATVRVCVDDADNSAALSSAAQAAGVTIGVLVEVDIGMRRCGVAPGEPVLALARRICESPGLHSSACRVTTAIYSRCRTRPSAAAAAGRRWSRCSRRGGCWSSTASRLKW